MCIFWRCHEKAVSIYLHLTVTYRILSGDWNILSAGGSEKLSIYIDSNLGSILGVWNL